jgi:hypothetical protein
MTTENTFQSPKSEKRSFTIYWDSFIEDIKDRENLKPSHLFQLRVLCDLCVEYDELHEILNIEGRTYESIGRNGKQIKMKPEVGQLSRIITQIKDYSKMLGLVLYKDKKTNDGEDTNEFDD